MFGPPLPTLSDPLTSLTVLAPDDRIGGLDGCALGRRERRVRIVFGGLVRIEGKRGRHVLGSRRLLGGDVAGA